jgi:hypothetical protein
MFTLKCFSFEICILSQIVAVQACSKMLCFMRSQKSRAEKYELFTKKGFELKAVSRTTLNLGANPSASDWI